MPEVAHQNMTQVITETAPEHTRAASSVISVLKNRSDFLRVARGRRVAKPGFVLQVASQPPGIRNGVRVGFTCSKKVGNAVARNRAKRRLREIARHVLSIHGRIGFDYVLIGRAEHTAQQDFLAQCNDLRQALRKLHEARSS